MVTVRSGSTSRVTVTVRRAALGHRVGRRPEADLDVPGASSSVMETVVVLGAPSVTPVGSVEPKLSCTLSPSSSSVSWAAWKLKVFAVSPELKVTLVGTPE